MRKLIGLFVFLSLIGMHLASAQEKTVTGTVTDALDGSPLPGVTIKVKGTERGTASNIDGTYSIRVGVSGVLEFSFIGMKSQEIPVKGKSVIDVRMETATLAMDEVVVTAQGMSRQKKSLGYATQEVKSEELVKTRQMDLNNALVGKVAGVRFLGGSGAKFDAGSIVLRGTSSLSAQGTAPIYVIDGVISSASAVNMDDVESVNVLKGPAATALYGSRGGAGAVIIKTKALTGEKQEFEVSHSIIFEEPYLHYKFQREYGGGKLGATGEMMTFHYDPSVHASYLQQMDGAPYYDYWVDESWGPKLDGRTYAPWYAWDPTHPKFGQLDKFTAAPKDNLRDMYQTGMMNTTNVSFARSGKDHMTRVSFTNVSREGVVPNSDANRRFLSFKTNFKVTNKLRVDLDYKYTYRKNHNAAQEGYGGAANIGYVYSQWFHTNVRIKDLKDYKRPDGTFRTWNITSPTNLQQKYSSNCSPFTIFNEINYQNITQYNTFKGEAIYDVTSKIKAGIRVNGYLINYRYKYTVPENIPGYTAYLTTNQYSTIDMQVQGYANYSDRYFKEKLSLDAALFLESRSYRYEKVEAFTRDGLIIDKFFSTAGSVGLPGGTTGTSRLKTRSIFGTLTAGWNNTYYLDVSLRNDWSSTLPKDKNSYLYGGVSVAAIASNWIKSDVLNFWKLRASVAQVGTATSAYNINETYQTGKYGSMTELYHSDQQKDPHIKPTISTAYEIGTEFRMFNNRLWGDFNFYNRDAKNQIINVSVTPASGYSSRTMNAGKIRNRGVELSLGGAVIKTTDWEWDIDANIAHNRNKLVELDGNLEEYRMGYWGLNSYVYLFAKVGEPIGEMRGSAWKKDPQGRKILTKKSDGSYGLNINGSAQDVLGNIQPDWTGGFSTSVKYKSLTLSMSFDYQIGGKLASVTNMNGEGTGLLETTVGKNDKGGDIRLPASQNGGVRVDGVEQNADGTYTPVTAYIDAQTYYGTKYNIWEPYIYDASYLKMRQLALNYEIPSALLSRLGIGIKRASVAFVAENPWLIHSGVPYVDVSESGGSSYVEGGQAIATRSFGFTVKMTF